MIQSYQHITVIAGSRTYNNLQYMMVGDKVKDAFKCIDKRTNIILSGGCSSGADAWAKKLCRERGYRYLEAMAWWGTAGITAAWGHWRNDTMAYMGTRLLAFWDGKSTGTANIIDSFIKLNKPVWVVEV